MGQKLGETSIVHGWGWSTARVSWRGREVPNDPNGLFQSLSRGLKGTSTDIERHLDISTYAFPVPLAPMLGVGSVFDGVLSIVWKPPAIRYRENCRRYREKYLHKLHKFETQTLSPLIFLGLHRSGIKHIFEFKSIHTHIYIYIIIYIHI